jgi:hypothetical protein
MKHAVKYLLCFVLISFLSCNDDDVINDPTGENPPVVDFTENFGSQISARFLGRIVDEDKAPLQGVTVRIGMSTTTTDAFGVFTINDANAFEKFAYITAEKDGYIEGSRALVPSASGVNQIEIMLLEKDVVATINSGEASSVDLDNGTTVTFDGDFVMANGNAYDGTVDVILKHLDPGDDNMTMMMPGMLFAQNSNGNAVALETYGMLAVELKSASGEDLQLAEGSTSQITIPLAEHVSNPPSTMPLWYFDEDGGYWIEDGVATLQGNTYVGEVTHFTFWNYDFPYPAVNLCVTIQDENGNPVPYTSVDLYSELLNTTGTYGGTDENGVECGLVPQDEYLILTIYNPFCVQDPVTVNIEPLSTDSNLTFTIPTQNSVAFTGSFLTCDGSPVTNGYIQLFIDGISQIIPITNGTINYSLNHCDTTSYSLKGIDIENNQLTDLITGSINGNATIDLGMLSACTGFDDSDNDGVFDIYEDVNSDNDLTNDDTDGDGTPNYLDEDDDGDGVNTADEDYDGDNDPTNDDTDGDGIPNYLDANDLNIYDFEIPGTGCDPVSFDLDTLTAQIYNNPDNTYLFYPTEADAMAGTNPLSSPYTLTFAEMISGQGVQMVFIKGTSTITGQSVIATLYLFLEYLDSDQDGLTDCEEITGIDDPSTPTVATGTSDPNDPNDPNVQNEYPTHGTLEACDFNGDGFGIFDLTVMDYYFTTGILEVTTSFHHTQSDAAYGNNPIVSPYTSIINPETLYVRIENMNTGEVEQISTLDLIVHPYFFIPNNLSLTECIVDGAGFAEFDLTQLDAQVLQGATGYTITYHETLADAEAAVGAFVSPFTNTVSNTQTIYIRVEHMETGCYSINTANLIVDPDC